MISFCLIIQVHSAPEWLVITILMIEQGDDGKRPIVSNSTSKARKDLGECRINRSMAENGIGC